MNKLIFIKRKHASSSFFYFEYKYVVMKNVMALFTMYLTVPYMPNFTFQNMLISIYSVLRLVLYDYKLVDKSAGSGFHWVGPERFLIYHKLSYQYRENLSLWVTRGPQFTENCQINKRFMWFEWRSNSWASDFFVEGEQRWTIDAEWYYFDVISLKDPFNNIFF